MKRFFAFVFMVCLASGVWGQKPRSPKLVDKDFRREYRSALRQAEDVIKDLERKEYDFYVPIISRVPTGFGIESVDNWGKSLLLPEPLRARIISECVNPVVVKISDTGIDEDHPELSGNWWLEKTDYTGDGPDLNLHGTHVAGIAFGVLEDLIRGGKVQMKDCRTLGSQGQGNFSWAASMVATEREEDFEFIKSGVPVIYNMSWGGMRGIEPNLESQLKESAEGGVFFITSGGNNGGAFPSYPAASAYVIAVSSLDASLVVSDYSTTGEFIDCAAPGRDINSTVPGGGFAILSGSSMSAPFVTAATAIALSKWGDAISGSNDLHAYLQAIATDIKPDGWDSASGWGLVYLYSILDTNPEDVIGEPPPPPPIVRGEYSSAWNDFVIRWGYDMRGTWNVLQIEEVKITVNGKKPTEDSHDRFSAWLPTFFQNRGIVLSKEMTGFDAGYWTGRFLEFIAKREGFEIEVEHIHAVDEFGRLFIYDNLKGSAKALLEGYEEAPKLIFIPTQ